VLYYSQFSLREISILVNGEESLVDVTLSYVANENGDEPLFLIEINSINRISRFMKEPIRWYSWGSAIT